MKNYIVGVILSTTIEVEAEDEDEAEEIALNEIAEEYLDLNVEEANFVEELEDKE